MGISANLRTDLYSTLRRTEGPNVHRQRHQNGSLQVRKHGKRKMWILLYRDGSTRRYVTLGACAQMNKSQAQYERDKILAELKSRNVPGPDPTITFGVFLERTALPFLRAKWKASTGLTTENRIRKHLLPEYQDTVLQALNLHQMQQFLITKAQTHSRSIVAHLRWDLRALLRLALAEGYIERDPSPSLYTPKGIVSPEARVMTGKEVNAYIAALDTREQVIAHLALFTGLRPGEILALQRQHISAECSQIRIEQRVYQGKIDTPKTRSSTRTIAVPSTTAKHLRKWMEIVGTGPDAWVFPSENAHTPLWRENLWTRHMQPKLESVGLDWANFQELRRTHASLGHDAGVDPKVAADQRGHGIGVAIDVYTKAGINKKAAAASLLEKTVLSA